MLFDTVGLLVFGRAGSPLNDFERRTKMLQQNRSLRKNQPIWTMLLRPILGPSRPPLRPNRDKSSISFEVDEGVSLNNRLRVRSF